MIGLIIVILIIVSTTFLIVKLRIPAAFVFFSLLVGQLLVSQVSIDAYSFISSAVNNVNIEWVKLLLLLLPMILTMLFLKGSISKSKIFLEVVPAILTGATLVILLYPLVPALQNVLKNTPIWQQIDNYKSLITFGASLSSLITSWMTFSKAGKHH